MAKRATSVRTIKQKRKGIAGLFGKKKEIQIMPYANELYTLSDSLTAMQRQHEKEMDTYAESLRTRNRILNIQLNRLITDINEQIQTAFAERERKMAEAQDNSTYLFSVAISLSIILLFLSYLTINSEIRRNAHAKIKREELIVKLQEIIQQNEELMREKQNIMQTITHELRSPLSSIRSYAEMIVTDEESSLRIRHAETIANASSRMARMIDMLLN